MPQSAPSRSARMSRADIILIALLLTLALSAPVLFPLPAAASHVTIKTPYKVLKLELSQDRTLEVEGKYGPTVIQVKDGRVRIVRSACPDNDRHRFEGWAADSGRALVCLPNQVTVTLSGSDLDSVVR